MAAALEIEERRIGPVTVVDLAGRLVAETGDEQFRQQIATLVSAGYINILVNLEAVTYLDSAGVGVLVSAYLHVFRRGGRLKLLRPSARANHVLGITKLTEVFELFDSEEEAVRSFDAPQVTPTLVSKHVG